MQAGFTWDTQDKEFDKKMALETWQQAEQYLKDKDINLVVLDELTYMINYKYLDEQVILNTLNARPKNPHGLWGTEYARLAKITTLFFLE